MKPLIARTGLWFYPLALLARFPFAMMSLGVLTLVVAARGSVELGGWNAAVIGLGMAIFGPLIGAAADHFGQRNTLLINGIVHSIALGLFAWLAYSPYPDWVMLIGAFFVGASGAQASPMSRSRLVSIIQHELPVEDRPRVLNTTLAYESVVDEIIYVFGPVAVGVLATAFGAAAPVIGSAVLTLIFVTLFALHRTSQAMRSKEERALTLSPVSALWAPKILIIVAGSAMMGMYFGSMITGLTSFVTDRGSPESAGVLYGVQGVGSGILAVAVAWFSPKFTLRYRWIVFAAVMVAGSIYLQTVTDVTGMIIALAFAGLGVGPMLVTIFSLAAIRTPEGRSATTMTMVGTGITIGQSIAAAVTGVLSQNIGTAAGLVVPLIATVLLLAIGFVNRSMTPKGGRE